MDADVISGAIHFQKFPKNRELFKIDVEKGRNEPFSNQY